MLNDRLNNLLDSLGLDASTPPDATQWDRLLDALRHNEVENRALRLSERRTANLLQAVPDQVFLVSADGRILDHRPGREFATFVPPEKFLGRKFADVLPETVAERLRTAVDHALTSQSVCITEYTLGNREYEARLTSEDGESVVGLVRDVTLRRTAERELRRSEAIYANLFQNSTDGIILFDTSGTILNMNRRAVALFGFDGDELIGRQIEELLLDDSITKTSFIPDSFGIDDVVEIEARFRRNDGTVFVAEVSATTFLLPDGRVVQAILRDITQRRRFEESLKRAKEEAEKANRAKSQFLSNMSHELKTPLNAILGFGRVLARESYGELSPRQREYLQDILQSGEHMLELVNNLLDLRQLEAGEDFLRITTSHLHPLVEEAAAMVGNLAETKGLLLSINLPTELPEILVDHRAVVRTLVNLLSNAIQYTRRGGHIEIRAAHQDDQLRIEVRDTGVGIALADQQRIFGYFEQIRSDTGPMVTGSGIGLALSRELVERMGGTIGVRSEPGKGSCFHFTVPFSPVDVSGPTEERLDKTVPSPFRGPQ